MPADAHQTEREAKELSHQPNSLDHTTGSSIGRIERVPLRDVWKHEALDFTTWLERNIDALAEALSLRLSNAEREQDAGDFSVDLVAEDATGGTVVIENQLEKSDHDHLGKLLTYLAALEAKTAVWIVSQPRPEHIRAVGWLNESGLARFFLVQVEAIRIGASPFAPLFTMITGPSVEQAEFGEKKKEVAERHDARYRFFSGLLESAKSQTKLHANISPGTAPWVGASAGRSGLALNYVILKDVGRVELYIDVDDYSGDGSGTANKALFDFLEGDRASIEAEFGESLVWERLDDKRASRVSATVALGGWKDEEDWPEIQKAMIDIMIRFERTLRPRLTKYFSRQAEPVDRTELAR